MNTIFIVLPILTLLMPSVNWIYVALVYLAAVNVVAFFMYGIDKYKAKHGKWRVKESTLIGMALLGGSIGAWLGMRAWHHKTQHLIFKIGIPFIFFLQLALLIWYVWSGYVGQYFVDLKI